MRGVPGTRPAHFRRRGERMHRTTFVPRSLWCLLVGLALMGPSGAARAQEIPSILVVPINSTKQVEMSKGQIISTVRNENPKVARVAALLENPRAVLITGLTECVTRVHLTDKDKNTEVFDVQVPSDAA